MLGSLLERFYAKITTKEESKDIEKIHLTEMVGNLQTYELGLSRIGKSGKGNSMTLKAKSSDTDESSDEVLHHKAVQEIYEECQWEEL